MRIFPALFRKRMPHGHIFRGKDRLVKIVTPEDKAKLRYNFEIEERNMFYLRHAFLTPEQSCGHARALGKREARMQRLISQKKNYYDNVTLESRLGHLRYSERWE